MSEELFKAQYDVTKKSKIKKFYDANKILIYSFSIVIIVIFSSYNFYLDNKEKRKIDLSEKYVQSKIYLEQGKKEKAKNLLKEVIFSDDPTYSTLCFFLILNQNLISDDKEILELFNHVLNNNSFNKEVKNLLLYKKALLVSNNINESELLKTLDPLINSDSVWKPHALLLLGDYFVSKNEKVKAIEFYQMIFIIKDLNPDLYNYATSQLALISNE